MVTNDQSGGMPEQMLDVRKGPSGGVRRVHLLGGLPQGRLGGLEDLALRRDPDDATREQATAPASGQAPEPCADQPAAVFVADGDDGIGGAQRHRAVPGLADVAVNWDRACDRADRAVTALTVAYGRHPCVLALVADGDLVVLVLRVVDVRAWYAWRTALRVPPEAVAFCGDSCVGTGTYEGVPVRLMGLSVPTLLESEMESAAEPYRLWDQVYDLALPYLDIRGNEWRHQGVWAPDGIPLLTVTGRTERCRLSNIVVQMGPLIPVRPMPSAVPVPSGNGAT
ncbi:BN159_2729 family protein [Streptomyces sediminimaris]|uniref:BN159_2729 family protein n=1 Tax=Streptomyces sediminimaris TaxID=3383721 RepID=UPI00399B7D37